jgi:thiol-disulfide isomerase/thioredoxin
MSDIQDGQKKRGGVQLAVGIVAVLVVLGVLYGAIAVIFKPQRDLKALAVGHMAQLAVEKRPEPGPEISFKDASGKVLHAADLKGQVVVMNIWATWCGPCKIEMPTLARLQAAYAGKPVKVVAISTDTEAATGQARAFIAQHSPLAFYQGSSSLPFQLKPAVVGYPTTIIIDRQGQERARMPGEADWSSAEAKAVIDRLLKD